MTGASRPPDRTWRAVDVCERLGITYRQLDYWCREGVVQASVSHAAGSRGARLFNLTDIVSIHIVCTLLNAGLTLARIRSVLPICLEAPPRSLLVMHHGQTTVVRPEALVELIAATSDKLLQILDLDAIRARALAS